MSDNTDSENSDTYRVTSGNHYRDGERYSVGDTFEPTDRELETFSFKLEKVDDPGSEAGGESEQTAVTPDDDASADSADDSAGVDSGDGSGETESESGSDDADSVDTDESEPDSDDPLIPDDRNTLISLAQTYPGDDIDGRSKSSDIQDTLAGLSEDDLITLYEAADEPVPDDAVPGDAESDSDGDGDSDSDS